jgi:hypothetical protein
MSAVGNILWIVLGGGIFLFFEYLLGGVVLCVTIIGIPFGVQCMKLSLLALVPFGKEVTQAKSGSGCISIPLDFFWGHSGSANTPGVRYSMRDNDHRDSVCQTTHEIGGTLTDTVWAHFSLAVLVIMCGVTRRFYSGSRT